MLMRAYADWPGPGPIDLFVHDLPHRSAATEWWYVHAHLSGAGELALSVFAAFFRIVNGRDPRTGEPIYAHSCTWAISDPATRSYEARSYVDPTAPTIGLERIRSGRGSRDPRLNRAMSELLEKGRVPAPDRILDGPVHVGGRRFELDFGCARFYRDERGAYRLQLSDDEAELGCSLVLEPDKAPVRHGEDGVVRGPGGENMFYYFVPRLRVDGTVTRRGREQSFTGSGWYDHEFGAPSFSPTETPSETPREDIAWNWVAIQLDGGEELTVYSLERVADGEPLDRRAVFVDAGGRRREWPDCVLEPEGQWRSVRTFYDYPQRWRLTSVVADLDLIIEPSFPDQELLTCISKPAFWEGRCEVRGRALGREARGLGYFERSGFEPVRDLDEFFGAVGEEVRRSVATVMPLDPPREAVRDLIASPEREQYLDGVDPQQIAHALFKPLRLIADRGGKSWRSYAALACCDVVGGDSRRFVKWLAVPELMHVGSLIVDDVEDRSTVRRGGPACHVLYGDALAINSGTAGYFITENLLCQNDLSDRDKLRIYSLYFEAMRAGHAGQAIDLDGLDAQMERAVRSGDSDELERAVKAKHRLKAAAPAAALARMGAVAGGGTDAQIEAVGRFFEALGLAFQIIDDVLNLRGFAGDLKQRGEDISNGAITLPVAKAMSRLDVYARRELSDLLLQRATDPAVVEGAIEALERCGAIQACIDEAHTLVEDAWQAADPLLPDTLAKVMLRAFGWYILDRHY